MCGITGIFNCTEGQKIEMAIIKTMAAALVHRGPDDSGFYSDDRIGLGFQRLSIIDLTTGNQPIFNENQTLICVCNGEIYNYKDLKKNLLSKGHTFYTQCDVEVLVHLYEDYGPDFVTKLNGQFAFALYDQTQKRLMLARDHVGIAPLFYTVTNNKIIFGSEIKAILNHPQVKREVDLTALDQLFTFPSLVSPRTMFKHVHSLQPGHFILVHDDTIKDHTYWDLDYPIENDIQHDISETYCIEKLDDLLTRSVQYRLQADVPVGFYLSGGMDSSLIASLIHKLKADKRHSFSIGFQQADIDERKYQQLMADTVGSIHHHVVFDWPDISNRLKQVIYHAETPLKESYDTCSLTLSELVKQNHIKVVLTGEGADELFAGYVGYRFDVERLSSDAGLEDDPYSVEMMMEKEIREKIWGDPNFLYERHFFEFNETRQAIYSSIMNDRFHAFNCLEQPLVDLSKLKARHPMHKRSYIDFKLRIADHLLADHGDRVAYANSIEARYPFLDVEFIDFVKTIPPRLMINQSIEKYILKRFSERYLPESIIRREKFAFVAPGSPYLMRQNIEWVNDLLSYETIKKQGYFNPDTIERLKTMYRSDQFTVNQTFEIDLLMIVITFGLFLELFSMPNA